MFGLSKTWVLDPRLEKDSFLVNGNAGFQTRLMNDSRWPWLIVVPIIPDIKEIEDLYPGTYFGFMGYLSDLSKSLKKMGVCTSTNVATIGNIVTQMHWHVVGRNEGDPNWPGPVWGYEKPVPYAKGEAESFIADFRKLHKFPI